jgi:hypothetical protein
VDVLRPDAHSDVQQLARHLWPLLHHTLKLPAGTLQQHKVTCKNTAELTQHLLPHRQPLVPVSAHCIHGTGKHQPKYGLPVAQSQAQVVAKPALQPTRLFCRC